MSKKLIVTLIVIALAGISYGGKVVGSWETTTGDGWIDWGSTRPIEEANSANVGVYSFQQTIGVTNGSYSLGLTQDGWGQSLALRSYEAALGFSMSDLLSNTIFAIDVTYDSGSWPSDTTYAQVYELSMQTDAYGWNDVGGSNDPCGANGVAFSDTLNPGYPGGLPLVNQGTPGTVLTGTWMWDYSAILPGGSYTGSLISTDDGYVNFIFAFNADTTGTYYFDNARLIPEPTTIALLGLGGLLLRRRKH